MSSLWEMFGLGHGCRMGGGWNKWARARGRDCSLKSGLRCVYECVRVCVCVRVRECVNVCLNLSACARVFDCGAGILA